MGKKFLFLALFSLLLVPAAAQEHPDTTFTFCFVADDDMFYVPWRGNGEELDRLLACVAQYKTDILRGAVPVYVDGSCHSFDSWKENLATAKFRANRVKTELILRGGLTEECFVTRNRTDKGNYVIVHMEFPSGPTSGFAKDLPLSLRAIAVGVCAPA